MDNLRPPNELNIHEVRVEWPKLKKNFNIYRVAAEITKKKKDEQLAIILHIMGRMLEMCLIHSRMQER